MRDDPSYKVTTVFIIITSGRSFPVKFAWGFGL